MKAKLNQFVGKQQSQLQAAELAGDPQNALKQPVSSLPNVENIPVQVEKPEVLNSASAEIADIDQRLHALQTFLKAAKAGGPGNM